MAQLRKLYTRVQDAASDTVASPTVSVLRVGAIVTRLIDSTTVAANNPGALKGSDQVYVIRSGAILDGVTITFHADGWTYNAGNSDWTIDLAVVVGSYTPQDKDRFVLTGVLAGHFVDLYDDDVKTDAATTASFTAAASGLIEKWVDARDVDIKMVSGANTGYSLDIPTEGRDVVTPEEFGAVGDGSTDDTVPVRMAIDSLRRDGGGTLDIISNYFTTSEIAIVGSNIYFRGHGTSTGFTGTDGTFIMFNISGDNIAFDNMKITNGSAVDLVGADATVDTGIMLFEGTSPTQVDGLTLRGVVFDGINGEAGLNCEWAKNILIDGCVFTNISNMAVGIQDTCDNIKCVNSHFSDIVCTGTAGTGRWFFATGPDELLSADATNLYYLKDLVVDNCTFHNNPTWEGLDTHGGENIRFTNNKITDCHIGILVSAANGTGGAELVADPKLRNVLIQGNTIDKGSAAVWLYGIIVNGTSATGVGAPYHTSNIKICDNTIIAYGGNQTTIPDLSSSAGNGIGAVNIDRCDGVEVSGNRIVDFHQSGVLLKEVSSNVVIKDNVFHNALATAALTDRIACVTIREDNITDVTIKDNVFWSEDANLTHGVYAYTIGSNDYTILANHDIKFAATPHVTHNNTAATFAIGNYFGTGTPEGSFFAAVGATYQQDDGDIGSALWLKESGAGSNTGWGAVIGKKQYCAVELVQPGALTLLGAAGAYVVHAFTTVVTNKTAEFGLSGNVVTYTGPATMMRVMFSISHFVNGVGVVITTSLFKNGVQIEPIVNHSDSGGSLFETDSTQTILACTTGDTFETRIKSTGTSSISFTNGYSLVLEVIE